MIETLDRKSLLRAMSIVQLLNTGWRPGPAELSDVRHVENWGILPSGPAIPFRIMGYARSAPTQGTAFVAAVLAIDLDESWARIWDEWVIIGDRVPGCPPVDPAEIQRIGASWLLGQVQRLPHFA